MKVGCTPGIWEKIRKATTIIVKLLSPAVTTTGKGVAYANVAQDGDSGDFYVTVLDPLGVADFLCRDYTSKAKNFRLSSRR